MTLFALLLQAGSGAGTFNLLFMGAMILVMWLFFIRPQAKKQREQKEFMNRLERGEEVVTSSGIIGRINKIEGEIVTLEVATKVYIRVTKNAISKDMSDALFGSAKKPSIIQTED